MPVVGIKLVFTQYFYLQDLKLFWTIVTKFVTSVENRSMHDSKDDDSQNVTQFGSSGDDLQAFMDEFDLMISNQDVIQI